MGECWKYLLQSASPAKLIALDFSGEMVKQATAQKNRLHDNRITVLKENVFRNSIPDGIADCVVSGFGLKTFDSTQLSQFAGEIRRVLKPGGEFSLIDVSVPANPILRFFYLFYLKHIIPLLGWLFLGNPETYRMLGVYTENFKNAQDVAKIFREQNSEVEYIEYFFGCASGVRGKRL